MMLSRQYIIVLLACLFSANLFCKWTLNVNLNSVKNNLDNEPLVIVDYGYFIHRESVDAPQMQEILFEKPKRFRVAAKQKVNLNVNIMATNMQSQFMRKKLEIRHALTNELLALLVIRFTLHNAVDVMLNLYTPDRTAELIPSSKYQFSKNELNLNLDLELSGINLENSQIRIIEQNN